MRSFSLVPFSILVALGVFSLLAAPAAASTTLSAGYLLQGLAVGCELQQDSGTTGAAVPGSISEIDCPGAIQAGGFTLSGSAAADFGTLRAVSGVTYADLKNLGVSGAPTARASFDDEITLDVAGRSGEVVDLVFSGSLSGNPCAAISGSNSTLVAKAGGYCR